MWYVTKLETGLSIGTVEPKDQSYVELRKETPDSVIYQLGCIPFDELMGIAKKQHGDHDTLIKSYKEVKNNETSIS